MDRSELAELWDDMWKEGNWVPSWPDSLAGVTAVEALWKPEGDGTCIWQEVVHVTFWRNATLGRMAGQEGPSDEVVEREEFRLPDDRSDAGWERAQQELKSAQEAIAAAITDETADLSRVPYHILHDAYHLGRITYLRKLRGNPPKF